MSVIRHTLKINTRNVNKIERAQQKALFETVSALQTDVVQSQTMPFDTGNMQNDSTFVSTSSNGRKGALITRTPYALRVYYHPEFNFQKTKNPNAQGLWLETYLTGAKKDFCKNVFAKFLKKEI